MKKVVGCFGILFLCLVVGVIALLVLGYAVGDKRQHEFFQSLLSEDPRQLQGMFHPRLKEQIDEPVLKAVMRATKDTLGEFKGLSKTDFRTNVSYDERGKVSQSKGTALFTKGQASCELVFLDDQVVQFNIENDEIVQTAFSDPEVVAFYRQRGIQFLQLCFDEKLDEAYTMLDAKLQKEISAEKFNLMVQEANLGPCTSITPHGEKNEALETGRLKIYYESQFDKGTTTSSVDFGFNGMGATIWGFYLVL